MEWFVEMPDGTLRAGFAWHRPMKGSAFGAMEWVNLPPKEGRHITKAEFDQRTVERRTGAIEPKPRNLAADIYEHAAEIVTKASRKSPEDPQGALACAIMDLHLLARALRQKR